MYHCETEVSGMRSWIVPVVLVLAAAGCARKREVEVKSTAFPVSGSTDIATFEEPTSTVDDFRFCVSRIRLEEEGGGSKEMDLAPGLINVSEGEPVDWGTIEVPEGFEIDRVRVKVHKDKRLCGVDYSVKFNEATSPQDVEFRFRLDPPLTTTEGVSSLELSLKEVVAKLRQAADSGSLASLKDRVEEVEGSVQAR
jgi:hypothetical protein